jgi:hypothetical protein
VSPAAIEETGVGGSGAREAGTGGRGLITCGDHYFSVMELFGLFDSLLVLEDDFAGG